MTLSPRSELSAILPPLKKMREDGLVKNQKKEERVI